MIVKGGGMEMEHNLEQVVARINTAAIKIREAVPAALMECGIYLLGECWRDYRMKSRGQPGKAGDTWPPITRSAIITRFWRTRPDSQYCKLLTETIIPLRKEKQTLLEDLRRRMPPGSQYAANRKAIAAHWLAETREGKKYAKVTESIRKKQEQRRSIVDKDLASAKIGIDSGRLINSLQFGTRNADTVMRTTNTTITLGTAVEYAQYYDALRPIFPVNFMTETRRKRCENTIKKHAEKAISDSLGDSGKDVPSVGTD